jgi:NDP-sugar pyrophosphorylase family protein
MIQDINIGMGGPAPHAGADTPLPGRIDPARVCGVVLAGVHSWGDCVLEQVACRPLLPVASRPLIWHTLNWMGQAGVRTAVVCANSDTLVMRRCLGRGEGLDLTLEYCEDIMPRGPAGCVRDAALATPAETIIVADGTIVPQIDLAAILQAHAAASAAVTVVVTATGAGDGRPTEPYEPTGIYVFARSVLDAVPPTGYQDIKETLIPRLYRSGARVVTHVVPRQRVLRVTDAVSYLTANLWAVEQLAGAGGATEDQVRDGKAWVHPTAQVDPTARFVGPVLVGARSVIEHGALVVGPTTIGGDCRIAARAVVSRSAVWDRCQVGAGAIVDQSILTDGTEVEAELVVRETVCLPARRREGGLLNRLASYRQRRRRPTRAAGGRFERLGA